MLAALARRYGPADAIELRDIPAPVPGAGQVRVRVRAASLNPLDCKLRSGALRPFMRLSFPAVLGFDLAGEVEALGAKVTRFSIGQRVYGRTDAKTGGTHAELAVAGSEVLDEIPAGLSFVEAASLPLTGMTAIQALRDEANLSGGQRLLVNGAAGGVGIAAVQLGHAMGATVTGAASGASAPLVSRLGASKVLDYRRNDLHEGNGKYEVILDTVANRPWRDFAPLLANDGVYVTTGFSVALAVRATLARLSLNRRVRLLISRADGELMQSLSRFVTVP